jgi:hypothetical protein
MYPPPLSLSQAARSVPPSSVTIVHVIIDILTPPPAARDAYVLRRPRPGFDPAKQPPLDLRRRDRPDRLQVAPVGAGAGVSYYRCDACDYDLCDL